jgi:leader peptidase (prepilin peptidase)/N-methyltransferase
MRLWRKAELDMDGVYGAARLGPGKPSGREVVRLAREEVCVVAALATVMSISSCIALPGIEGLFGSALALLMLFIAIFDRRYFVIPDEISAAALLVGLCFAAVTDPDGAQDGVLAALGRGGAAAALFWLVRFIYWRMRKREGIGLGDVKLAAVGGVWLSLSMVPVAVELASIAALGSYALQQGARGKSPRAFARLPFGQFLAPAIWFCWLFEGLWQQLQIL